MCRNYSENARNFALFSEKNCQQKFSAPYGRDGCDKYHLWSWHNVLCLQGRPSWLWNWQTSGRKTKPEYHYSIVRKLLLLGHLLICNYIPFTFSPFYLFRSNRSRLLDFPHCPYLLSEYKIKRKFTHVTYISIHTIMRPKDFASLSQKNEAGCIVYWGTL